MLVFDLTIVRQKNNIVNRILPLNLIFCVFLAFIT